MTPLNFGVEWEVMKKEHKTKVFHDLLGDVSSVRNALYFLLMGKTEKLNEETKDYLKKAIKKCDQLVEKIEELRKNV